MKWALYNLIFDILAYLILDRIRIDRRPNDVRFARMVNTARADDQPPTRRCVGWAPAHQVSTCRQKHFLRKPKNKIRLIKRNNIAVVICFSCITK